MPPFFGDDDALGAALLPSADDPLLLGFCGSAPLESPPAGGVHKVAGGEQQRCARSLGARGRAGMQLVDLSFVRTSAPVALFSINSRVRGIL